MADFIRGQVVGAERVIERFQTTRPATAVTRLRTSIRRLGYRLQRKVQLEKLSGQVLGKRSGRLVRSVNTRYYDTEYSSTASTGTALKYGRFWELGFHGVVEVKAHTRHVRSGSRQQSASGLGYVQAHSRRVNQAPRPFLKPSLLEMRPAIHAELSAAMRGL